MFKKGAVLALALLALSAAVSADSFSVGDGFSFLIKTAGSLILQTVASGDLGIILLLVIVLAFFGLLFLLGLVAVGGWLLRRVFG
jgi:hypothetical protein